MTLRRSRFIGFRIKLTTGEEIIVSTFTGLTDTPASYTGQSLQTVRVNSGETALEFVDLGVIGTGATLPTSPSEGQVFLHTPTGRKWLMQYEGTTWFPVSTIGETVLYVDDSANGSQNWNEGDSTSTRWDLQWICPQLPQIRAGNIDIYLANRSFNVGDAIQVSPGLGGLGKIRFYGNTTTKVTSTVYSSGSTPYQSMTMTSTVTDGAEGDIIEYASGTNPGTNSAINSSADVWCLLSRSGTNLQIAGGMCSNVAPVGSNTAFSIKGRNTTFTLTNSDSLKVESAGIEFWYINFQLNNSSTLNYVYTGAIASDFIGCGFEVTSTASTNFDGLANCKLIGCYISGTGSNTSLFSLTSGVPAYIFRCLFRHNRSGSSTNTLTLWGAPGNLFCIILGCRFDNTTDARVGRFYNSVTVRFNVSGYVGVETFLDVGGSTYYGWDLVRGSGLLGGATGITIAGTLTDIAQVDATTFCWEN